MGGRVLRGCSAMARRFSRRRPRRRSCLHPLAFVPYTWRVAVSTSNANVTL